MVFTLDVSNGGFPIISVYMITPKDQMSTSYEWPFLPSRISGATYDQVPQAVRAKTSSGIIHARLKSVILMIEEGSFDAYMMFSSWGEELTFKSR